MRAACSPIMLVCRQGSRSRCAGWCAQYSIGLVCAVYWPPYRLLGCRAQGHPGTQAPQGRHKHQRCTHPPPAGSPPTKAPSHQVHHRCLLEEQSREVRTTLYSMRCMEEQAPIPCHSKHIKEVAGDSHSLCKHNAQSPM